MSEREVTRNVVWSNDEIVSGVRYEADIPEVSRKNRWNDLFVSPEWMLMNPADEIVSFYWKYIESPSRQVASRVRLDGRKIHDLGCGSGRHVYYFAELGFDVTGSDLSTNSISFVQEELGRRRLDARVTLCPMTDLPFSNSEFDITISRATINHATLEGVKKTVQEIARTTKPGGLFFVTFSSERSSDWRQGLEVVENVTYIPESGPEEGLVHTYMTASNTAALLEPYFRIEELYLAEHPPLITRAPGATDSSRYFGSEYVAVGVRR